MEPECSLQRSQDPVARFCPEPDEISRHPQTHPTSFKFVLILFPSYTLVLQVFLPDFVGHSLQHILMQS
jgi:hypothetical protein